MQESFERNARIAELMAAKKLEYTYLDDSILMIEKRGEVYKVNIHDPYTCTNCWDEPKLFNGFDDVLKYILDVQKKELEGFAESIAQFAVQVNIVWDDEKLLDTILAKFEICK